MISFTTLGFGGGWSKFFLSKDVREKETTEKFSDLIS
jgi:hypothetical protein